MAPGIVLVVGKYLLIILIYVFVIIVFRALMTDVAAAAPQLRQRELPQPANRVAQPRPITRVAHARPCLVVVRSTVLAAGQRLPLGDSVSIGRRPENAIVLDDRYVSSRHALILVRDDRYFLQDYNSTNGTFVNGQPISDDVEIHGGDEIAVGSTVFRFIEGS